MTQTLQAPLGLGTVIIDDTQADRPHVVIMLGPKLDGTVDTKGFDLDDLHKDWKPGEVFYDSALDTKGNQLRATLFLETLAGIDQGDAALLLHTLEGTMPAKHYTLQRFVRPQGTLSWRICAHIAPKPPKDQVLNSFNRLNSRFGFRHYAAAIPMMAIVFGLIALQGYFLKWTLLSPITLTDKLSDRIGWSAWAVLALLFIMDNRLGRKVQGVSFSPYMSGFFNRAATSEEQAFREGAENWSTWERLRSCVAFALIHQPSLIYILGMIVPHALMGGAFMAVYLNNFRKHGVRRNAVLAASIFHRLYNRIALIVMVASLLFYFSNATFHWVMAAVSLGVVWSSMVVTDLVDRRVRR